MDNLKKKKQDRRTINPNEKWEVSYWTKKLGINAERLREIIKRVGNSVEKVRGASSKS